MVMNNFIASMNTFWKDFYLFNIILNRLTPFLLFKFSVKICISTKHLSRVIKDILDKTPHEIICDELMKQAFNMLEDESVSVGQIAENLNFADQASFCKFFKKRAQISPMEYKKRMSYKNIHLSF